MSSGFGLDGGRGRCFHFWQEFNKCYASADLPQQCLAQRDDYLECLHHTKEFARITRIKAEELKQAQLRQKQKKDAVNAANSNVQKLNIIEEKASA
ncbi:hypothetical protein G6F70_003115 [Rhizopus microsporus]|uniref:NADH dehydrogenase [ubiquinone] iron-sulfur protein 5 n=4 Tax=Rhizopus TaxID=4842 RepID=A0A2G4TB01_RHIZD|nr:uncharacterized protein RHIMIDRAFT_233258 [Rhizopus microsporus ATCC 52813]KAG1176915.1 hypothetical protein G6F71_003002 [Rhizopus microsporus]ORE10265.1 hypothetical protein BCV72DRAFT_302040 [Rhizopus microsporus var. microsporus]RCH99991.1 hypothetical protein CU097_015714 [Rhizopus azygosporus]KAG1201485.1 hypothetical protein G6F70_003115 [Rhizopus microsporus]KAG1213545.1 hypothetical protein G6F69_002730 [Rhizopus microsporus]